MKKLICHSTSVGMHPILPCVISKDVKKDEQRVWVGLDRRASRLEHGGLGPTEAVRRQRSEQQPPYHWISNNRDNFQNHTPYFPV